MLRYLTAGESHGKGLTVILEGMPAGVPVSAEYINVQLSRRQKGHGRGGRMNIETDCVDITSGVRNGLTLGSPISLIVLNKDWKNWQSIMQPESGADTQKRLVDCPRPGHADLTGGLKYNHRDLRNILERASARETTVRVAAGAVARTFLEELGIRIVGHVVCIAGVEIGPDRPSPEEIAKLQENDPVRCIDPGVSKKMVARIDEAKKAGNSAGGIFEIIVTGMPPGVGSHVQWDRKLDGQVAQAMLSIQAIKGVEFGLGFKDGSILGSEAHDEIYYDKNKFYRPTNRAGGFEGGMTNGENLIIRVVKKPIATLYKPMHSVNIDSKEEVEASVERSDSCAVPAACVIGENVLAITLANALMEKFGGDSLGEIKRNLEGYQNQIADY